MMYKCLNCGKTYTGLTQDGCCDQINCFGEPLVADGAGGSGQLVVYNGSIEGLCVLVCDISGSMDAAAFQNHPAEKLKLVTGAVHKAIAELEGLTKAETAYIAIVAFGARAGLVKDGNDRPFIKSVAEILTEYGEYAAALPSYLYSYFKQDLGGFGREHTDVTAGLSVARKIFDCALSGDMSSLGISASASLIEHSDILTQGGNQITMPNIRVMMYSDGAHNPPRNGPLINAFDGLSPSPLMTAFIGDEEASNDHRIGADQMRSLANECPEHGQKGYFLINSPERHAVLRSLFRMASGASGFCPQCLRLHVQSFEKSH